MILKNILKYLCVTTSLALGSFVYAGDCKEETIITPKQTVTIYNESSHYYDSIYAKNGQQTTDIWVRRCTNGSSTPYYTYQLVGLVTEKSNNIFPSNYASGYIVQNQEERIAILPSPSSTYISEKTQVIESSSTISISAIDLSKPFRLILDSCQGYETMYQNSEVYIGCNIDGEKVKTLYFNGDSTSTTNTTLKISGSWYDPAYNGMGFNIGQIASGTVIYYYGYEGNQNGQPLWLISAVTNKNIQKNTTYSIEMFSGYAGNGADFNTKPTVDSGVQSWGTLELTFNSCSSGVAILRGNDGEQTFNIVSLAPIDGINCQE